MASTPERTATLVVFCRRPAFGAGKRRLVGELGEPATLRIGELLLAAALEDLADWPGPRVIAPADTVDADWVRALAVRTDVVVAQPDGNLGVRLAGVDNVLRRRGHNSILYIGSDAPVLGPTDYAAARQALATHDVVLGPALDGGVTCMGSRRPWPDLANLPWSGAQLHTALRSSCVQSGFTVLDLQPRYDIDVPADLHRLRADLAADTRPARLRLYRELTSLGYCNT